MFVLQRITYEYLPQSKYFENVLQGHGNDLDATVSRALASYNGLDTSANDVPQDAPTYNGVPAFVSNYQAREALRQAGLFPTINAAIKGLGEDSSEYQAWEYANNFYRDSPLITTMAAALGMDATAVDALFTAAKQIN